MGTLAEGSEGGATVWFTGLSGSGKSTISGHLLGLLEAAGVRSLVLDGDDLREGLNADLGFTEADRAENVRRVGEVALLFARAGYVVLVPVISPYAKDRKAVRERHGVVGTPFVEVHVATSLEVCEARDPKGLYEKARAGRIERFTGVSDPYEPPERPEIRLETEGVAPDALARSLLGDLETLIRLATAASRQGSASDDVLEEAERILGGGVSDPGDVLIRPDEEEP